MCGIAAIVAENPARFKTHMRRMLASLAHRGPDGEGALVFPSCILGHTRLGIMDPERGEQPMSCAIGNAAISYNGELYGWGERVKDFSYPFATRCDTEMLLAAYVKYGADMCNHLNGMFAFALWDEDKKRLLCGRDRFGEKPIYYAYGDDGEFIAASEIKAILASGLICPHVDRNGLSAYLRMGYVPDGESIFSNIKQLPPGHMLAWQNGSLVIKQYWRLPQLSANPPDLPSASEEMKHLLEKAVRRCLMADVEIGILLSGGLDSTTIASIASRNSGLRSFAFGMAGARNELPYARAAARRYGLPLQESYVDLLDFSNALASLADIYDEPLADTSCLPTLMLCDEVSRHVKTALAGDGGDELLGGYAWYSGLDGLAERLPPASNGWSQYASAHFQRKSCCSSRILCEAGLKPWFPKMPGNLTDTLDDAFRMDALGFLPGDVLKKTDRAAMHFGLELRSPFLDVDVAEFLLSLPPNRKIGKDANKLLLRRAFENEWPSQIRHRPKQGFGMSCPEIMARDDVADMRADVVNGQAIRFLLPGEWLEKYGMDQGRLGWNIFILALWAESMRMKGCLNG